MITKYSLDPNLDQQKTEYPKYTREKSITSVLLDV